MHHFINDCHLNFKNILGGVYINKDTINLRDYIYFEIEVYPDVLWVPANCLGKTRYTNEDMKSIVSLNPIEKKENINNLYEAIQLFQFSKFTGMIDNVRIIEEDSVIIWVFHKPGFHSVRTNEGCCAADSNWLSYILKNKYDEIGCLGFLQADGNGHIINYIKHNDWYYFIDMMMQRYDSIKNNDIENGILEDYYNNETFGYIHKAKSFNDYIKYCLNIYIKNPPQLFYKTNGSECFCIGSQYYWHAENNMYHLIMARLSRQFFYNL